MEPRAENEDTPKRPELGVEQNQRRVTYRPELPDWGVYLRWPEDGNDWIHPEHTALAQTLIPSRRIFNRTDWDGEFYHLNYGKHHLRVRPSMWTPIGPIDLCIEQQVELLAQFGKHDPGIFRIEDILYTPEHQSVEFILRRGDIVLETPFTRQDIKPIFVRHHLRTGFYEHVEPKQAEDFHTETLDVGDLTDES